MPPASRFPGRGGLGAALAAALLAGCAGPALDSARRDYYAGRFERAGAALDGEGPSIHDRVMFLMERGMVRQARGDYEGSTLDWLEAVALEERLDTYSASKAAGTMLVNDRAMDFRGAPFERTMLHTFLALNFLARAQWEDAAVEARNIIDRLENREGFPDDAFSRYIAGFALEAMNDGEGAALQYRTASELLRGARIEDRTGRILPAPSCESNAPAAQAAPLPPETPPPAPDSAELVCVVLIGRAPSLPACEPYPWSDESAPYAEIHADGRPLGRSRALANLADLQGQTQQRQAAMQATRFAARLATRKIASAAARKGNEDLGNLLEFLLLLLERPDTRQWETLPLWLEVARVPCPRDFRALEVEFRDTHSAVRRVAVPPPIARRGRLLFAFCRDLPPAIPEPPRSDGSPPSE